MRRRNRPDLIERVEAGTLTPLGADRIARREPGPDPATVTCRGTPPTRPELSRWPPQVEALHQELLAIEADLERAEDDHAIEVLAAHERRITARLAEEKAAVMSNGSAG